MQAFLGLGNDPWNYRFFPSELAFFMAGSVGYKAYANFSPQLAAFVTNKGWLVWLFWLSILTYSRLPGDAVVRSACFLAVTPIMVPLLFAAFSKNGWDRAIGELSYPLYLLHMWVLYLFDPIRHSHFYSLLCLVVGLASAYLFYWLIERQLELYRANLFRRDRKLPAVPASP
jgi:peptidoglycan/LPS O-acetylase OafA/YrhL